MRFLSTTAVAIFLLIASGPSALAAKSSAETHGVNLDELAARIDMIWVMVAAALILMMQLGFMLLEAGSVRTKNAISVAQKNLLDFAFATLAFAVIGFGLAFGSFGIPTGLDSDLFLLNGLSGKNAAFFVFQVMFCGTAATIVSGAVAERMRLRIYVITCVGMAAFIYPVFTHWAWGNALAESNWAFLANAGFVDFAGSTVVHATGGWLALAACIVLGSREGRFSAGAPMRIGGHSAVMASVGVLFLFVGWIGFNGGSTLAATDAVPGIILNTILAGSAGGAIGYGFMWFGGAMLPERAINGMIGGLVAVTAGCHLVDPTGAVLLGTMGGLFANGANQILEKRFRIDDAVGAVGAHGVAGVVGTLGLALLAPVDLLPAGSRGAQLLVQAWGSALNFAWAFGTGIIFMVALRTFSDLRVGSEEERVGLNSAEHGVGIGTDYLQAELHELVHSDPEREGRLAIVPGDENDHLKKTLNSLMDRLQAKETERLRELRDSRDAAAFQQIAAFGEVTSDGFVLVHEGNIQSGNSAAAEMLRTTVRDLPGKSPETLVSSNYRIPLAMWLEECDGLTKQAALSLHDGTELPVELRCGKMNLNGHEVVVMRLTDMSERELARERIYYLALHDTLTDLPNRELFNRRLKEAIENQRSGDMMAVLMIDIDRFKDVNDLHGHPAGDALLGAIAERLLCNVRDCDTVARLGGDEFAVIYPGLTFPNQALDLAHRMLSKIGQPLTLPGGAIIYPRASIGVAVSPKDGETAEDLIRNADMALYSVKKRGRNNYSRYEPEMGRMIRLRQELENDLALAVARDELELHFQPRIDLGTGKLASFEALVRWRRGDELIRPDDFISIAEESGLILPIGAWVIKEACKVAMTELGGAAISVNVSARQFQDAELIDTIREALESSGLQATKLELEITESVLIDDDRLASRILTKLRDLGVKVALDDFGTGYSSLSYLTRFNFDTIKIDRSFVQSEDERTWHVIRSVLSLSEGLKTSVVAEGVETQEQFDRLAAEGCREVQGFFISHPVPALEALNFIGDGAESGFRTGRPKNSVAMD